MSLAYAGLVCLVVVLALLYLGLVRVYYDVRQLRRLVLEQGRAPAPDLQMRFPRGAVVLHGRTVLALSTTCPTCWDVLEVAREHPAARSTGRDAALVVLTYQDPTVFGAAAGDLTVVASAEAWSVVSHLTPPALLRVGPDGVVEDVALPASVADVSDVLTRWHGQEERGQREVGQQEVGK